MVEPIDGQHFGVAFRSEWLVFNWKMDVDGGLLPTILCLEGVSAMLKVIVQLDVLYVHVEEFQLLPLKFGMLGNLC